MLIPNGEMNQELIMLWVGLKSICRMSLSLNMLINFLASALKTGKFLEDITTSLCSESTGEGFSTIS